MTERRTTPEQDVRVALEVLDRYAVPPAVRLLLVDAFRDLTDERDALRTQLDDAVAGRARLYAALVDVSRNDTGVDLDRAGEALVLLARAAIEALGPTPVPDVPAAAASTFVAVPTVAEVARARAVLARAKTHGVLELPDDVHDDVHDAVQVQGGSGSVFGRNVVVGVDRPRVRVGAYDYRAVVEDGRMVGVEVIGPGGGAGGSAWVGSTRGPLDRDVARCPSCQAPWATPGRLGHGTGEVCADPFHTDDPDGNCPAVVNDMPDGSARVCGGPVPCRRHPVLDPAAELADAAEEDGYDGP